MSGVKGSSLSELCLSIFCTMTAGGGDEQGERMTLKADKGKAHVQGEEERERERDVTAGSISDRQRK